MAAEQPTLDAATFPDAGLLARSRYLVQTAPTKAARRLAALRAGLDDGSPDRGRFADRAQDRLEVVALEAALDEGARCSSCGRELSDPRSVVRGVGPECSRKLRA